MNIYFTDFFNVPEESLEEYGAFNISLINDLPLFIDPFLLFNSDNQKYQELHDSIIEYLRFLKEKSNKGPIAQGLIDSWFKFPEVKQNWLGFSKEGNSGSGLGSKFAKALNKNLHLIFEDFGDETITKGSHLEKLCIINTGVGKDNISDFTLNLIKEFICEYTEKFALENIESKFLRKKGISRIRFNYRTEIWESKLYTLPFYNNDFVLLTPKDILTKDESWINKADCFDQFDDIVDSIPNHELRAQINNYLNAILPQSEEPTTQETKEAQYKVLQKFPTIYDFYIRMKENNGGEARSSSSEKVELTEHVFIKRVSELVQILEMKTDFYRKSDDSFIEALERVNYLKQVIENNDGYKIFYIDGQPVKREGDLHIMFRFVCFASVSDVNSEVNNGRGPVDFKLSNGRKDKTLVEFKLASNSKLSQNLKKQVEIYKAANETDSAICVILFFNEKEEKKVNDLIVEHQLSDSKKIVLIDARNDNKPSGSTA